MHHSHHPFRYVWLLGLLIMLLFSGCASRNAPRFPVTIENQSSHAICKVRFYISGSYHTPARNLLGRKERIPPAGRGDVLVKEGSYDIRIETCDGLVTGTDYFLVPRDASWTVREEMLFAPVR